MIPALLSCLLTDRTFTGEFYVEWIIVNQVIRIEPEGHGAVIPMKGRHFQGFFPDDKPCPSDDRVIHPVIIKHREEGVAYISILLRMEPGMSNMLDRDLVVTSIYLVDDVHETKVNPDPLERNHVLIDELVVHQNHLSFLRHLFHHVSPLSTKSSGYGHSVTIFTRISTERCING